MCDTLSVTISLTKGHQGKKKKEREKQPVGGVNPPPPSLLLFRAGLKLPGSTRPASCRIGRGGNPVTRIRMVKRPATLSFWAEGTRGTRLGVDRHEHETGKSTEENRVGTVQIKVRPYVIFVLPEL